MREFGGGRTFAMAVRAPIANFSAHSFACVVPSLRVFEGEFRLGFSPRGRLSVGVFSLLKVFFCRLRGHRNTNKKGEDNEKNYSFVG